MDVYSRHTGESCHPQTNSTVVIAHSKMLRFFLSICAASCTYHDRAKHYFVEWNSFQTVEILWSVWRKSSLPGSLPSSFRKVMLLTLIPLQSRFLLPTRVGFIVPPHYLRWEFRARNSLQHFHVILMGLNSVVSTWFACSSQERIWNRQLTWYTRQDTGFVGVSWGCVIASNYSAAQFHNSSKTSLRKIPQFTWRGRGGEGGA